MECSAIQRCISSPVISGTAFPMKTKVGQWPQMQFLHTVNVHSELHAAVKKKYSLSLCFSSNSHPLLTYFLKGSSCEFCNSIRCIIKQSKHIPATFEFSYSTLLINRLMTKMCLVGLTGGTQREGDNLPSSLL